MVNTVTLSLIDTLVDKLLYIKRPIEPELCVNCTWSSNWKEEWDNILSMYEDDPVIEEIFDIDELTSITEIYESLVDYLEGDYYLAFIILYNRSSLTDLLNETQLFQILANYLIPSQLNNIIQSLLDEYLRLYEPVDDYSPLKLLIEAGGCLDLTKDKGKQLLISAAEAGAIWFIEFIHNKCPLTPRTLSILYTRYDDQFSLYNEAPAAQFFVSNGAQIIPYGEEWNASEISYIEN